jgi:hypothetical protein
MALEAYIAHQIPGRLRLKIPAAKGRPDLLQRIVAAAGSASDVKSVECNSLTGSVLIHHAPQAYKSLDAFGSILGDSTLRVSVHPSGSAAGGRSSGAASGQRAEPSAAAKAITSFFKNADREIRELTGNELDLKVLLPLVAGVLGLLALRRRATTPLWLTLLIFAFHSFLTLHGVAVAEEAEEAEELAVKSAIGTPSE